MFTDLSDCFYLADLTKVYFVPHCDGDIRGECTQCTKRVCKGFWGGDGLGPYTHPDDGMPNTPKEVVRLQTREERVEELTQRFAKLWEKGEAIDNNRFAPSLFDRLPVPDPRTMLRPDQIAERVQRGSTRVCRPTTFLWGERVDWDCE